MIRLLPVVAAALLLCGCAFGGVGQASAWGIVLGAGRIDNCIQTTKLDLETKVDPEGNVIESKESRISEISENCYKIAGGSISEQGAGVMSTILAPIRWIGSALGGAAGG